MTVITSKNDEKARNKPIITGAVNNLRAKVFLDSGADINIVDRNFALNVLSLSIKDVAKSKSSIKCANATTMQVFGECSLQVTIGNVSKRLIFIVVENVFPSVILGLVALKELKIVICPEQSCIFADNIFVPFLSKVVTISKNAKELC